MSRRLLISTVVLVVITLLVVFIKTNLSTESELVNKNLLTPKAITKVDNISIANFNKTLAFAKKGNFWVLKGQEGEADSVVDSLKLLAFLSQITEIKLAYVASTEKKEWNNLQLYKQGDAQAMQENTGTYINLSSKGKSVLAFVVGKDLTTGNPPRPIGGNYIRLIKSKEDTSAYVIKSSFYALPDKNTWMQKKLLPSDMNKQIQSVNIAIGNSKYSILRKTKKDNFTIDLKSTKWQANQVKLDALVDSFDSLTMNAPIKLKDLQAKAKKERLIHLTLFDSTKITIQLFNLKSKQGHKHYATFLVEGKLKQVVLEQLQFLSQNWAFEIPETIAVEWSSTKTSLLEKKVKKTK